MMRHPKEVFCDHVIKATQAIGACSADVSCRYEESPPTSLESPHRICINKSKQQWLDEPSLSHQTRVHLRGQGDAIALALRFHDSAIHHRYRPHHESLAHGYDALEETRLFLCGTQDMVGLEANLQARLSDMSRHASDDDESLFLRFLLLAAAGKTHPHHRRVVTEKARVLADFFAPVMEALLPLVHNQDRFAQTCQQWLTLWNDQVQETQPPSDDETDVPPASSEEESLGDDTVSLTAASDRDGDESHVTHNQPKKKNHWIPMPHQEEAIHPLLSPHDTAHDGAHILHRYRPYNRHYDSVCTPMELASHEELRRLRQSLDDQIAPYRAVVVRLAKRLQRRLLAKHKQSWQLDCEEGFLDGSRLARLIANPLYPTPWRQEQRASVRHTVVTLLIDNSGSMRGRPIALAAMCADILACTLERCGVKSEICGFTTNAWKGGRLREQWTSDGKPQNPGRLNELLHIIYKDGDTPMRHGRQRLGLMLKEGLLKENIDGEALLWACQRLLRRSEDRRILLVISDGAPVDDSTFSANHGNLLEDHLAAVVHHIENHTPIELKAIGIGHDVSKYYRHAVTISDATQLGETLLEQMEQLFLMNHDAA